MHKGKLPNDHRVGPAGGKFEQCDDVFFLLSTVNFLYTYKCGLCMAKLGFDPSLA